MRKVPGSIPGTALLHIANRKRHTRFNCAGAGAFAHGVWLAPSSGCKLGMANLPAGGKPECLSCSETMTHVCNTGGTPTTTAEGHTGYSGTIAKRPASLATRPYHAGVRDTLPGRLELPTLRLTASPSNQLSYGSDCIVLQLASCIITKHLTKIPGLHCYHTVLLITGQLSASCVATYELCRAGMHA